MILIGSENYINIGGITAICDYNSNPVMRRVKAAEDHDMLIDATNGRKRKSVIFMNDKSVVLSCISTFTLNKRSEGKVTNDEE